ncbi:MAG: 3,4-dehydroadipyl-CoA semialdehyde dehydrogenase [Acidobacteriota bacterium]|nr:3,4-dehydroadipyl-CoA semialdehyde dehydrogenase [Acidobacteriota bacterium]
MKRLRSYVEGRWHEADQGFVTLYDPSTEEAIAEVSSVGIDFAAVARHARERGRRALAEWSISRRAECLTAMSSALHEHREELIDLSLKNSGATRKDAKFDLDGATFTLAHYGRLGAGLDNALCFIDGDPIQLGRSARFSGQHVWVPLQGVAVLINAFNFPAWGFAEKTACALLAGMPVIVKPATSTAMITERCVEILVEADILPEGVFSFVCGSTGDLLSQLGPQDVMSFTGSADTALKLKGGENLLANNTRTNIEADSLNAAVLAPSVDRGSETWGLFLRDVAREITQKSGQKCTAVRRIFVPTENVEAVQSGLIEILQETVTGDPRAEGVTMGPLCTKSQLEDTVRGVEELTAEATVVHGTGARVEGKGADAGTGYFFAPTLLLSKDPSTARRLHQREVFGPVSTLMPYDGDAETAADLVGRSGGTLVTSVYGNEISWLQTFIHGAGATTGRIYIGSEKVAGMLPGSGVVMPQVQHGGPGRAGGGSELGGERGLQFYLQRVALAGDRALIEKVSGQRKAKAGETS